MTKMFRVAMEEAARARMQEPIEVEVDELSTKDRKVTVRFKGFLTVAEYNGVNEYASEATSMHGRATMLEQALFAALAVDEDGNKLVPDPVEGKTNWFEESMDPVLVSRIANKAGLFQKFYRRYEKMSLVSDEPPEDDEDPKE